MTLRTFSHLQPRRRVPTDYEIVTTDLHYYPHQGFAVATPVAAWYRERQADPKWGTPRWETFSDPLERTFWSYVVAQKQRETFVDGILRANAEAGGDAHLSSAWLATLETALPPLRFAWHGMQMVAAYCGQMAPDSKLTVALALQAADETRRIERLAYRCVELKQTVPNFGDGARLAFETGAAWKPLREALEKLLVTYDWVEALIGLNVCLKPLVDDFVLKAVPEAARTRGDGVLGPLFQSLLEDARDQRAWTKTFLEILGAAGPEVAATADEVMEDWRQRASAAVAGLQTLLR